MRAWWGCSTATTTAASSVLLAHAWERDGVRGVDPKSARVDASGVVVLKELGEVSTTVSRRTRALDAQRGRLVGVGPKSKIELVIATDPKPCR